jgi:enoyl-CoA hydratase
MTELPKFETLALTLDGKVAHLALNRPDKANSMSATMWTELHAACRWLDETPAARVVVLSGNGKHFCAGIDLALLQSLQSEVASLPAGHRQERLRQRIIELQACISAFEHCRKPVIAAIHGACVGGGIDLITACDMRFATADARFSVKEIDLAIVADVGTLQRLPRIVGEGIARELVFTARDVRGEEAREMKLVNRVFATHEELMTTVMALAQAIAAKSPLAVRGTKETLNYSRDHTVAAGLEYVAAKNASLLFAPDVAAAATAFMQKRTAAFED